MVNVTFTPNGVKASNAANTVKILSPDTVKQGDTKNDFLVQLIKDGVPLDLTGKTVTWSAASNKGKFVTDRAATVEGDGTVGIEFTGDDVGATGSLRVEFKVTYADGDVEKFPAQNYAYFEITRSLDDLGHTPVLYASVQFFEDKVAEVKTGQEAFEQTVDGKIVELESTVQQGIGAFTEDTEVVMARGGEVNLGARLDKTTAQLAETEHMTDELRTKTYSTATKLARKPIVTFMFDDAFTYDYDVLKPLADSKGIPISIAYITGEDNGANRSGLSLEKAHELENSGWEIMSHTVSSSDLTAHDDAELERQFAKSKSFLLNEGFKVDSIVYPVGLNDVRVRDMTRKYYRAGYGTEAGTNVVPLRTQRLFRVHMPDYTLENIKGRIDSIGTGWLVLYSHTDPVNFSATQQQKFLDIVDYVQSKNIEIMTGTKALNHFENTLEIENEGTGESFKVGADGKLYSNEFNKMNHIYLPPTGINNDTPITSFERYKVTNISFTTASNSLIPFGSGAGTLTVYRINADDLLNYQMFVPFDKTGIAVRFWSSTGWEPFKFITFDNLAAIKTTGWTITDLYGYSGNDLDFHIGSGSGAIVLGLDKKKNIKHNYSGSPASVEGTDIFGAVAAPNFASFPTTAAVLWAQTVGGVTKLKVRSSDGKIVNVGNPTVGTASRPTAPYDGEQVYDTTIKKPIWYDAAATAWKDAMGSIV